jgi:hypothetical protein
LIESSGNPAGQLRTSGVTVVSNQPILSSLG